MVKEKSKEIMEVYTIHCGHKGKTIKATNKIYTHKENFPQSILIFLLMLEKLNIRYF